MRRSQLRTGALVALVFLCGAATGAFGARAVQQRRLRELVLGDPAALRARFTLYALDHRLHLTASQRAAAERVLEAQAAPYREALERCRPEVRGLRRAMAAELAPTLDEVQRAALEELVREGEVHR